MSITHKIDDDDVAWWDDMREWHGNNPSVRAEFQMWHMVIVAKSKHAKFVVVFENLREISWWHMHMQDFRKLLEVEVMCCIKSSMWLICCILTFDKAIDKGELVMDDDMISSPITPSL